MTRHSLRLLEAASPAPSPPFPPETNPSPAVVDSDSVVILAVLLCAVLCILGLVAVARCTWLHLLCAAPPPAKGVKKKVLRSLPRHAFSPAEAAEKSAECPICLAEFAAGDEIRVLPQCGHGFHVACIDKWLGSQASCPSCRRILPVERCRNCGSLPGSSVAAGGK